MKTLSNTSLSHLISKIKAAFWPKEDVVGVSTIELADVATSGSYNDLTDKPVYPDMSRDLSMMDVMGNALASRSTANTYVVREIGLYKFPLVYGNGIKAGATNAAAYTRQGSTYTAAFVNHLGNTLTSPFIESNTGCTAFSAELLWQTSKGMISSVGLVSGSDCRYIMINVANVPASNGFACIAVKDINGTVMWSWNIWVTADNLTALTFTNHTGVEYDMLPETLGTIWNADRTRCVAPYYQWGRKDAMPPAASIDSSWNMPLYDIAGNDVSYSTYGTYDDADEGGTTRSVANSIQMPDKFFIAYDETNISWNNLVNFVNFWNAAMTTLADAQDDQITAVKTIYDPSPVGYMVPAGRFATGFTSTGEGSSDSSEYNVAGSFANGWFFKRNANDSVGNYWPALSTRFFASGQVGDGGNNIGESGSFETYARGLYGTRAVNISDSAIAPYDWSTAAEGIVLRPARELT